MGSLAGVSLTTEQGGDLARLISEGSWPAARKAAVLECVAGRTTVMASGGSMGRAQLQDFQQVYQYYTMEQWYAMSDRSISAEVKHDLFLDVAIHLGLRYPSETTCQMLACLHRLAVVGPDMLQTMSNSSRFGMKPHMVMLSAADDPGIFRISCQPPYAP